MTCRDVPCDEAPGARNPDGYVRVWYEGNRHGAHRLAYELHHGVKLLPAVCVLHRCDNPPCREPRHLFTGTQKDNAEDRSRKDRNGKKLTYRQTRKIRVLVAMGHRQVDVACRFKVSKSLVSMIVNRKIRTLA